jgi:membrane protein
MGIQLDHGRCRGGGSLRLAGCAVLTWLRLTLHRLDAHWLIQGYRAITAGHLVAIVAFNALAALIPTLLLLVALAGFALRDAAALTATVQALEAALPTPDARTAVDAVLAVRRASGWFGVASLLGFVWIGTNFAGALAHCFNQLYGVAGCGFGCTRRKGVAVVFGSAGLLLLAGPAASVTTWLLGVDRGRAGAAPSLAPLVGDGIAFLAAAVFFLLLYRVLPNAGQRLRDVWPGALVAALLFVLAGQIFPLYLRWTGGANRFGTAFGLVWLLVTWLAAFAHLLLVGAYVNARRASARARHSRSTAVAAPGASLPFASSADADQRSPPIRRACDQPLGSALGTAASPIRFAARLARSAAQEGDTPK